MNKKILVKKKKKRKSNGEEPVVYFTVFESGIIKFQLEIYIMRKRILFLFLFHQI